MSADQATWRAPPAADQKIVAARPKQRAKAASYA